MSNNLNNYANNNWMAATPALDSLTLSELTLPGTHNAGCDWLASYSLPKHWLVCQHKPFYAQMKNGARALDLRLQFDTSKQGLDRFKFQHGGKQSSRNLQHLFADLNQFLIDNPDEFIILDFHELSGEKQAFDFGTFNAEMIRSLGPRMIPVQNSHLSLGQLKQVSSTQRVLTRAPWNQALDRSLFGEKIPHKWSGSNITSATALEKYITEVMKNPPGNSAPWSLSATSYSALGGPVDIHNQLDSWFDPAKSNWAMKCNIINVDFLEDSKIVSYCRTASLKKTGQ